MPQNKQYISITTLSKELHVSPCILMRLIHREKIDAIKRTIRITRISINITEIPKIKTLLPKYKKRNLWGWEG